MSTAPARLASWLRGWGPALRIARREALRAKGRSALVLVMIALPVLGVVAIDVVIATANTSGAESLDRRLGSADALVTVEPGTTEVAQAFDPDDGLAYGGTAGGTPPTPADVRRVLGEDTRLVPWAAGSVRVLTDGGVTAAEALVVDLGDPLAEGLFRLEQGRLPRGEDEVVVSRALADRGPAVGDRLQVEGGAGYAVVGVGESTSTREQPLLLGTDRALATTGTAGRSQWLVGNGAVSWDEVRALNAVGAVVLSRAVLEDPPPESALSEDVRSWSSEGDSATVAVAALVVVMALIEVVLLAGPAFAVGARRQARSLALLAANGGTPAQSRRVVLASAVVLGTAGALLGVALGVLGATATLPVVQRFSSSWFGPFEVRWLDVLAIATFGLVSAVLAALVPASIASRQDVVAVLAGRRGDGAPSVRSPLLGVALLGAGIAGSAYGATRASSGELVIAASAVLAVLGMVLLVPVVVAAVARAASRLPLPLRYAARDAARHRTRTTPAVAAVAASVAGVVALGIANASDAAENEATYVPQLPAGTASVAVANYGPVAADGGTSWNRVDAAVARELPGVSPIPLRGASQTLPDGGYRDIAVRAGDEEWLVDNLSSAFDTWVFVGGPQELAPLELLAPVISATDLARAEEALRSGTTVVVTSREVAADAARLVVSEYDETGAARGRPARASVPAVFVRLVGSTAPMQAVVPEEVAGTVGLPVERVGLLLDEQLETSTEQDLQEALGALGPDVSVYVERGYEYGDETLVLLLVLGSLGGLLMLGGTLTATFLALSDARPDLATLAAVGASPRSRRAVAASYALVVGLLGAVLGAAVGFVPGIAVTYPLTGQSWSDVDAAGRALPDHFLDVPWTLVGVIVVALPLVTALIVGVAARSRLPLAARAA